MAWIEGDEQTENVKRLIKQGETFESLMHGRKIQDWEHEIVCAQCYVSSMDTVPIAETPREFVRDTD